MIVLGIDPGLSGAIAMLGHKGELLGLADLPTMQRGAGNAFVKNQVSPAGLRDLLCEWCNGRYDKNEIAVFLEEARPMPTVARRGGQIKVLQGSATTFSMGLTAGLIEGVIAAKGYTHQLVPATKWKKAFGLSSSKEQARMKAQRMFPSAEVHLAKHHNRAEALLIARYGYDTVA